MKIKNPSVKSTPSETARVGEIYKASQEQLWNLAARWDEEKMFEDWNDYVKILKSMVPADCKFVKASKRPFGFTFELKSNGCHYQLKMKARYYEWSRA